MDFSLVTVDEVTGSDVKLGTLLERNGVGNGEIYDSRYFLYSPNYEGNSCF